MCQCFLFTIDGQNYLFFITALVCVGRFELISDDFMSLLQSFLFIVDLWPLSHLPPLFIVSDTISLPPALLLSSRLTGLHVFSISAHPSISPAPPLPLLSTHNFSRCQSSSSCLPFRLSPRLLHPSSPRPFPTTSVGLRLSLLTSRCHVPSPPLSVPQRH